MKKRDLLLREIPHQTNEEAPPIEKRQAIDPRVCSVCKLGLPELSEKDVFLAIEEWKKNFPDEPDSSKRLVCDDCFHVVMRLAVNRGWLN